MTARLAFLLAVALLIAAVVVGISATSSASGATRARDPQIDQAIYLTSTRAKRYVTYQRRVRGGKGYPASWHVACSGPYSHGVSCTWTGRLRDRDNVRVTCSGISHVTTDGVLDQFTRACEPPR